jgi:hypothetical protein
MPDDPAAEAIGIIGALNAAGLLQGGRSDASSAYAIIGALHEAGLIRADGGTAPAAAPASTGRQAGDKVFVSPITYVDKYINAEAAPAYDVRVRVVNDPSGGTPTTYELDFPPNDEEWLPEIDKIIAAPKPLRVLAYVEITNVYAGHTDVYGARLAGLQIASSWPRPTNF